ncbi:MAG: GntR family transcriptional regulator [Caldilineales bacterium]|nr:GntR family transcriptional regulator [Caldilineales bacterium]
MDNDTLAEVLSPPLKRSLADVVAERMRDGILSGQLAPGERLRETELSEMMEISRGPVREALRRLENEGLVVVGRTGRTNVARVSRQDLDEVFSLRRALERLAIERACEWATPEDMAKLQAVVDAMAATIARGISEKEGAELDLRFHDVIYHASRHQRLLNCWTTIRSQIYVIMLSRNVASANFRDATVYGHQEIVDAIKARDKERALVVIEQHMIVAYELVSKSYGQLDADPDQDDRSDGLDGRPQ